MVFWNELGSPRLHVGIDYNVDPRIHAFDDYCATQDVHPHWGVDQADAQAISHILDIYGSPPLSLVIDDASHKLASTISSFDILFPHLAPGGLYVIEDWAWSYDAEFLAANPKWRHHPELASIIPRLHSMLAEHPDYIEQIVSTPDFLVARRGPGQLTPRLGDVHSRTWERDARRRRRTAGFRHRLRRGR